MEVMVKLVDKAPLDGDVEKSAPLPTFVKNLNQEKKEAQMNSMFLFF